MYSNGIQTMELLYFMASAGRALPVYLVVFASVASIVREEDRREEEWKIVCTVNK